MLTLNRTSSTRYFSDLLKAAAKEERKNLNFISLASQVGGIFDQMEQSFLDELNKTAFISGDKIRAVQEKTHGPGLNEGPGRRRFA